jgi:tRNA nucleotidyltransferase (CCA-adding enzyme)
MKKGQALSRKDLAVAGQDLIRIGMKPGKEIGRVLDALLDHVLENPEDNKKELLLKLADTMIKGGQSNGLQGNL